MRIVFQGMNGTIGRDGLPGLNGTDGMQVNILTQ